MVRNFKKKYIGLFIIIPVIASLIGIFGFIYYLNSLPIDLGWTWISGNNSVNEYYEYGEKGVPDVKNYPKCRSFASSWTDSKDDLWLFGGSRSGSPTEFGALNDLWVYDGVNWTWMSGNETSNEHGNYGITGISSSTNFPGGRSGSVSWIDSDDNLWLFGGIGYAESGLGGLLNDLWKFDGYNWTWISGNKTTSINGAYGIKGISDENNYPGGRYEAVSWVDSEDNLWLFGGYGYDENDEDSWFLNDLWRFDGTNWTWISGNKTNGVYGIYGIEGIADITNYPGSRRAAVSWIDSDDNLWLFGGDGTSETSTWELLNDLWKFDGNNWTWVSGSKAGIHYGVYGSMGIPNQSNIPGCRYRSGSWTDSNDNFWLYGGSGYAESGNTGYLGDLWKFDGKQWTWMSGTTTIDHSVVYGIKGIHDATSYPGSRIGALTWIDSNDNLKFFGGTGYLGDNVGIFNDLWLYDK